MKWLLKSGRLPGNHRLVLLKIQGRPLAGPTEGRVSPSESPGFLALALTLTLPVQILMFPDTISINETILTKPHMCLATSQGFYKGMSPMDFYSDGNIAFIAKVKRQRGPRF